MTPLIPLYVFLDNIMSRIYSSASALFISVAFFILHPEASLADSEPNCGGIDGVNQATYLSIVIPRLHFEKKSLKEAANLIAAEARSAGADSLGFTGIAIIENPNYDPRIALDVTAIPLGVAMQYLADIASCHLTESSGLYILFPSSVSTKVTVNVFPVSNSVRNLLNLNSPMPSKGLKERLKRFGIGFADSESVVYYMPTVKLLYAKLPPQENGLLQALLTFSDRGVLVVPAESHKRRQRRK